MVMNKKKLPVGIEDFEKIRLENFYYIDKTGLIRDLLNNWGEVNLFTRPRRFGKTLNMSMLKAFFSLECRREIFNGLEIVKETELCEKYMGKFPVIFFSLKSINAPDFGTAREVMIRMVNGLAEQKQYLFESDMLTTFEKALFMMLMTDHDMSDADLYGSLKVLSRLLQKHHGQKVIILIDEYDVPLAKAFENGYYDEMIFLIRNMFEQVLKTNESLYFAVLTGCMRVSKESIFTGFNNPQVFSITDKRFHEYFGFTDKEVWGLMEYYGITSRYADIKNWYDGYFFGELDVYCPWDVLNACSYLRADLEGQLENYWINTSSNESVRRFIQMSDNRTIRKEIESLVAGESIMKEIHQELTYRDMYASADNIWSLLFTTGYLTQRGKRDGNLYPLAIPNMEIRNIFTTQIMELFKENICKDGEALNQFCDSLKEGKPEAVQKQFGDYLRKTISIRDTFVQKKMKENFYHGILLGLLGVKSSWGVFSNREAGEGYSDILIEIEEEGIGIIIEMKYAQDGDLDAACKAALSQIDGKHYEEELLDEGMDTILKYGIACYKKRCRVMQGEEVSVSG